MSQKQEIQTMLNTLCDQLDSATVVELVGVYNSNSRPQIAKMIAAQAQRDIANLAAVAHSLKSSSANLGAESLAAVCLKIEKSTVINADTAALVEAAGKLHEEALSIMTKWQPKI